MKSCIVILSFNHPEITARTVNSALKFNLPVLLVHNGSLIKHVDKLKESFPSIEHIVMEQNKGYSGGVNFGLTTAFLKYDWIYFLTNDTELITINQELPPIGYYAPKIFFRKLERIDSLGGLFIPNQAKLIHNKERIHLDNLTNRQFFYVPGTAFLIHKDIFNQVGGMDESLNTYWEDVDFSVRVFKAGFKLDVNEDFSLVHKVGKTCHDNPFYTTYLFKRNQIKISLKYSTRLGRIKIAKLVLSDLVKLCVKSYQKKDYSRLKLYLNALRDI